jgi:hypothetical protein
MVSGILEEFAFNAVILGSRVYTASDALYNEGRHGRIFNRKDFSPRVQAEHHLQ